MCVCDGVREGALIRVCVCVCACVGEGAVRVGVGGCDSVSLFGGERMCVCLCVRTMTCAKVR